MPNKLTKNEFVQRAINVHGNKYDYSRSEYINAKTKMIIRCPHHGPFEQTYDVHVLSKCGCPSCDPTNTLGNDVFIEKAFSKHGILYDYSKVNYVKGSSKVEIICLTHGSFFQQPSAHLRGQGCPACCTSNHKSNTAEFIEKATKIHNGLYTYENVDYKTKRDKVIINCAEHGPFEQQASVHLEGYGCKICRNSKMELYLRYSMQIRGIAYEPDKRFPDCRNILPLPFDCYIHSMLICIECDGKQHHEVIPYFGGEERLEYQKKNDEIKTKYCLEKGIKLYRVKNVEELEILLNDLFGEIKILED